MPSATRHPQPVEQFLREECEAQRVIGPLPESVLPCLHFNRFGVIPKSTPGKWRLILDLSFPQGASVNDGISPDICHLQLASVDDAVQLILELGANAYMAKLDIRQAYRNVPVHPQDRWLLGMHWQGQHYVDTVLPFGLRSAPKIFCAISDGLEWVLHQRSLIHLVKYIDDFLVAGSAGSPACQSSVTEMCSVCEELGIPLAMDKLEGPAQVITFLGIELDSANMQIRLPWAKLLRLQAELCKWSDRKACRKKDLLSLIGQLAHACKVVPAGRTFLRRMIDLSTRAQSLEHWIRLNAEFRSDLAWWTLFVERWNGVSMLSTRFVQVQPQIRVFTDASGWGCGGHWDNEWFQFKWSEAWSKKSIALRELVPVVMACAIWGRQWAQQWVLVRTDNRSVVDVMQSRSSPDPEIMHLLRCILFILACFQCQVKVEHIPGVLNTAADALSRNSLQVFQQCVPSAHSQPSIVPVAVSQMLMGEKLDWLSPVWRSMLVSICRRV